MRLLERAAAKWSSRPIVAIAMKDAEAELRPPLERVLELVRETHASELVMLQALSLAFSDPTRFAHRPAEWEAQNDKVQNLAMAIDYLEGVLS